MFNQTICDAAKLHAEQDYPNESCGLVVDNTYLPMQNIAVDPANHFTIHREKMAEHASHLQGLIHSHPDGPYYPSAADMQGQIATGVPWGIVYVDKGSAKEPFFWGDQLEIPPLKARPFQHGITDCYSLVRDYFRLERKVVLDEFPRDWQWWEREHFDLYEENFRHQGFEIIEPHEVVAGDVFLAQIRSKKINHAGVYTGNGLILHQIGNAQGFSVAHPSCEQPVHMWKKYIRYWARYCGQ